MNLDLLRFMVALVMAGLAASMLFFFAWALCKVEEAWRRRRVVLARLNRPAYEVAELPGRRRPARQPLTDMGAAALILLAGVIGALIIWRAKH